MNDTKKSIEIKARSGKHNFAREKLEEYGAEKEEVERQKDYYFEVKEGRLKLRERENRSSQLIFYNREDKAGPKSSEILLSEVKEGAGKILRTSLPVDITVVKRREIYWIENVKVHLDEVKDLGKFLEFELFPGKQGQYSSREDLKELMDEFEVEEDKLISNSYSDMIGGIS
ncbi:hypothetical protein AKJ57_03465 [candidate division MSBL1 archaeon SCGC-AAA259A05]|uniref:CYTH domain-containing protein n=1 Tax=candidate division MSBL1 archaeon SCGC-AAA259A05 TaxID=1698259 RepID=A0A133U9M1_9EURY|nr:hypothetical protein AKJ57_03465 [candidate division MSBL1 archaeon SCGC-AAA259A05]